jgi:hypothetical protein
MSAQTRSEEKRFTWKDAPELIARLTAAQNALIAPIDIMTFAGFCDSREELERHVAYYEKRVAEQPAPRARRTRRVA